MDKKLEKLAALEHKQWVYWSKGLIKSLEKGEVLSKKRLQRWKKEWIDYKSLSEETKEFDRKWARKVISLLKKRDR
jgi:hypothetical protein